MIRGIWITGALLFASGAAAAPTWRVEITNVTPGQTFTPILAATHSGWVEMFEPGQPASDALATLAESGDIVPLMQVLEGYGRHVTDVQTNGALLGPGESVTLTLEGRPGQRLSLAGMLIPTNDTFVGVDGVFLPIRGSIKIEALAYDAGSEENDQNCANIPGPRCDGAASSAPAAGDEGFVHVSNGFHFLGTDDGQGNEVLLPGPYTWNNPVAIVEVHRIHGSGH